MSEREAGHRTNPYFGCEGGRDKDSMAERVVEPSCADSAGSNSGSCLFSCSKQLIKHRLPALALSSKESIKISGFF